MKPLKLSLYSPSSEVRIDLLCKGDILKLPHCKPATGAAFAIIEAGSKAGNKVLSLCAGICSLLSLYACGHGMPWKLEGPLFLVRDKLGMLTESHEI